MKQITTISTKEGEFQLEELWSAYVFSYVFIFLFKEKLHVSETRIILINKSLVSDFHQIISASLNTLLETTYIEPTVNELQKHSTRFEKIHFNNKTFRVNYRSSIAGRLAYAIFSMMRFIENAKLKNLDIHMSYL